MTPPFPGHLDKFSLLLSLSSSLLLLMLNGDKEGEREGEGGTV